MAVCWPLPTGIAILTGLLFGIAPAWRGTRALLPQAAMKANARGVIEGAESSGLGKTFVTISGRLLSLVLAVAAGLMSFRRSGNSPRRSIPGFDQGSRAAGRPSTCA